MKRKNDALASVDDVDEGKTSAARQIEVHQLERFMRAIPHASSQAQSIVDQESPLKYYHESTNLREDDSLSVALADTLMNDAHEPQQTQTYHKNQSQFIQDVIEKSVSAIQRKA